MGLYLSKGKKSGDEERQFDDDYTLCQRLGKGAFAEVFMCVHKASKERRAVKIVDLQRLRDEKDRDHLEDEIAILKRLNHPGIIRLYDVYRSERSVYIVQELCSGGELFDRIVLRHHYTEHCARELVRHVLQAVSYAHSEGVVHRDLKPENILLAHQDDDTLVKLADFGLAHALGALDGLHTICGTPSYMSPEVISRQPYSEKTDCWSIGVIAYVLLGGFCPFEDPSLPVMLSRIKKAQYKFWNPYFRAVSEDAKDFIRHLLVVDPAKRLTARAALEHRWFRVSRRTLSVHCLVETQEKLKELRTARTRFKAAVDTVIGLNRMRMLSGGSKLSDSMSSMASSSDIQSPHNSSVSSMDTSNHGPTTTTTTGAAADVNRFAASSPSPRASSSPARASMASPDAAAYRRQYSNNSGTPTAPSRSNSESGGRHDDSLVFPPRPMSPDVSTHGAMTAAAMSSFPSSTKSSQNDLLPDVTPGVCMREDSVGAGEEEYGCWMTEDEDARPPSPPRCESNGGLLLSPSAISTGELIEGDEGEEEGDDEMTDGEDDVTTTSSSMQPQSPSNSGDSTTITTTTTTMSSSTGTSSSITMMNGSLSSSSTSMETTSSSSQSSEEEKAVMKVVVSKVKNVVMTTNGVMASVETVTTRASVESKA